MLQAISITVTTVSDATTQTYINTHKHRCRAERAYSSLRGPLVPIWRDSIPLEICISMHIKCSFSPIHLLDVIGVTHV